VIWYQNNGNAASWTPHTVSSGVQNGMFSMETFDANGDGNPDLLTTSFNDNTVAVYTNLLPSRDTTPPTVTIVDPAANPRNTATGQVTLQFSEPVWGVTMGDLSLTRNGVPVSLGGVSLVQVNQSTYTVNLSGVTAASGSYTLTLAGAGSGIKDLPGNALVTGASDSWVEQPALALSGASSVNEGSAYSLTLGPLTSPNPQPPTQYVIHWGDSTTTTTTSLGTVTHVYTSGPGPETISVDVVDPDGTHPAAGTLGLTVLDQETSLSAVSGTETYGGPLTLLATLSAGGLGLAGEPVEFTYENGTSDTILGTGLTNNIGVATLSGIGPLRLHAGDYAGSIVASFAGGSGYTPCTGGGDLTAQKATLPVRPTPRPRSIANPTRR
jgi:hypothetical protein